MKTKKLIQKMLMSSLFLLGIIACNKNDNSSSNAQQYVNPGYGPLNCNVAGCTFISGNNLNYSVLITATGTATGMYSQIMVAFDFLANGNSMNTVNPKAVITYSGPISLSGYLRISSNTGTQVSSVCGAAAGDYLMQPIQPGTMQNSIVTGGRISGFGPNGNRIDATIFSGTLYNSDDINGLYRGSPSNRVYLQMTIDSVNGQSCGISISTN
jgi:hypothetical protein